MGSMMDWRVARTCESGACVEVGQGDDAIGVRDSADPDGPVIAVGPQAWAAFTSSLKSP